MATARRSSDAAPSDETESAPAVEESAAPVAEEAPESSAEDGFRPPVALVFTGQAESSVAEVGLCVPGESYTVPAALARRLRLSGFFAPASE